MAVSSRRKRKAMQPAHPPKKLGRTLQEEFYCEARELSIQFHQCLTDYVNANALQVKTSPCHKCMRGLDNRVAFAKGRV